MNLRHIDPRSTDWMDAMLEGEAQTRRKREAALEEKSEDGGPLSAAQADTVPPAIGEPSGRG